MGFIKLLGTRKKQQRFEEVYREHYGAIVRRIAYLTGDVHVAEELAQEVFLKLYKTPPKHDNYIAWLNTVAARASYNYLRDERLHKIKTLEQVAREPFETLSTEELVLAEEAAKHVNQALAVLSARDRTCLLMKHSGYKYSEIAECLEIEINAVGVILARAQEKFKKHYENCYEQGGDY